MVKSGGSPEFSIAAYQVVGAIFCLVVVWFVPLPEVASWPYIAASVVIHNIYYFTLARSYRNGDLSMVYPLFRGLAPVMVAFGAGWFAGEWLPVSALVGVGLVSLGLIALAIFGNKKARPARDTVIWGLATSVMIALYTVIDGSGVRKVDNSLSYILWLFVFEPFPIAIWLLLTKKQQWMDYLKSDPWKIMIGGIASSTAYALVIYAMSLGAMALVSSLRETSVIFAAIIGTLILKEPFGRQRIIAACFVAMGVIVIRFYGST